MYTYTIRTSDDVTDGLSTVIMTVARLDENYEFEEEYSDDGSAIVTIRTSANIGSLLDTCDAVISYDYE
jgi:hypothetical protein